jgi:methyl-accepting chemotaxis protein
LRGYRSYANLHKAAVTGGLPSEVRALSGRTAEAAKEVKSLIAASSAQVAQGVARVGDAGKALQRIASRIVDIAATVRTIAAGAREQATGLAAATSTINELDAATQRNAAMAEQANAASQALNTHADELAQLISGFAIEETSRRAA